MIRRPPRSTQSRSSAASDVYKRQHPHLALPAAVKAGGDADPGAHHRRHEGRQQTDGERYSRAPDELREHRLTDLVGAEPVVVRRRGRMVRHVEVSGGVLDLRVRVEQLSLIHISEPTRLGMISYA